MELIQACNTGNVERIRELAKIKTIDYNQVLRQGVTYNQLYVVQFAIQNNADDFRSAFIYACIYANMKIIKFLLPKSQKYLNDGLEQACYQGRLKIIKYLIRHGANEFCHGLYMACYGIQLRIVKLMIKKGAMRNNNVLAPTWDEAFKKAYYFVPNLGSAIEDNSDNNRLKILALMIKYDLELIPAFVKSGILKMYLIEKGFKFRKTETVADLRSAPSVSLTSKLVQKTETKVFKNHILIKDLKRELANYVNYKN
jgi:ankyrin repeat protein